MVRLALPRPRPPDDRARQGRRAGAGRRPPAAGPAAAVLAALCHSACAAPNESPAGAPASLYVATTGDGTITQLDSATGRAVGAPFPAGPGPWQIATGPDGSLVALSSPPREGGGLTHVVRAAGWAARPVPLEPRARPTALAGDGGPYAAVAYRVQDSDPAVAPQPCRLALLDVRRGVVERTATPCGPADSVLDLAFEGDPAGPVAYLALWRWPADGGGRGAAGAGRVVALDLATGAATVQPPAGAPLLAVTATAPAGLGRRLYVVEGAPGPENADEWRLLGLNPDSLAVEHVQPLPEPPLALALAVAADGGHAYALAPRGTVLGRSRLYRVDLTTGAVRLLATLPGRGLGLAATADRIYVSQPEGNRVWTLDRNGTLVKAISVGRYPTAVALGSRR